MPLNLCRAVGPEPQSNSDSVWGTDSPFDTWSRVGFGRLEMKAEGGEENRYSGREAAEFGGNEYAGSWDTSEGAETEDDGWDVEEFESDNWDVDEDDEFEWPDEEEDAPETDEMVFADEEEDQSETDEMIFGTEEEDLSASDEMTIADEEEDTPETDEMIIDTDEEDVSASDELAFGDEEEDLSETDERALGDEAGSEPASGRRVPADSIDGRSASGKAGKPEKPGGSGGGTGRGERLLVTQALDERDLLVKKINTKINAASFVDTIRCNEEKVLEAKLPLNEFEKRAASSYQQIQDLITRFEKIDAAIVASNATTYVETSYGTFTVAAAIALRSRMKGKGTYGAAADFEQALLRKLEADYSSSVVRQNEKNKQVQAAAENMRLGILGRDNKGKEVGSLEVVDAYIQKNTTELADPLDARKKAAYLREKREQLISELDTRIKVSNATTFIELR
ncbi:MAG: hypothetical protein LUI13_14110 [Lachnospiraceae bacterium]|nr:hypothetical protein [Lachnospiraceae bacterium]